METISELPKVTYSDLLNSPQWQAKREVILKRDNYTCQKCEGKENLHVHHLKYIGKNLPWDAPNKHLVTLCKGCHKLVHEGVDIKSLVITLTQHIAENYQERLEKMKSEKQIQDKVDGKNLSTNKDILRYILKLNNLSEDAIEKDLVSVEHTINERCVVTVEGLNSFKEKYGTIGISDNFEDAYGIAIVRMLNRVKPNLIK